MDQETSNPVPAPAAEGCGHAGSTPTSASDNLSLWLRVEKTDPVFTSRMNGPFPGTAIAPAWLMRKATEQFGPLGIGWGYDIVEEKFVDGAPLGYDAAGESLGRAQVHILRLRLWYVWQGKRGQFEHFGQTSYVGRGANGLATESDVAKKSLTDALSKCLSMLGFGGDVHLGLFDDPTYVERMHREHSEAYQAAAGTAMPSRPIPTEEPPARARSRAKAAAPAAEEPSGNSDAGAVPGPQVRASSAPAAPLNVNTWLQRMNTLGIDGLEHARQVVRKAFTGDDLATLEAALDKRVESLTRSPSE